MFPNKLIPNGKALSNQFLTVFFWGENSSFLCALVLAGTCALAAILQRADLLEYDFLKRSSNSPTGIVALPKCLRICIENENSKGSMRAFNGRSPFQQAGRREFVRFCRSGPFSSVYSPEVSRFSQVLVPVSGSALLFSIFMRIASGPVPAFQVM